MNNFKNLKPIQVFNKVFKDESLIPVPESWYIIVTDIIGSTKAIETGKYKEVNISGGLAVMAVTNAFRDMEFPFVFGGDGVTILIPPEIASKVKDILYDTKEKIKSFYGFDLRVGIVPIKDLYEVGESIRYGKLKVSKYYDQAILHGSGVDKAEEWVKTPNNKYLVIEKKDTETEADFTGFTCRWRDIRSSNGETIALILKVRENKVKNIAKYYEETIFKIESIIGREEDYNPVKEEILEMAPLKYVKNEAMANSKRVGFFSNFLGISRIAFEMLLTRLVMKFKLSIKYGYYDIKNLRNYNVISSDYRKYDGTLKMILSISKENRQKLENLLEEEFQKGLIFYGLHVTNRALMTCLLHQDSEREVHFIDAADGGYARSQKIKKANTLELIFNFFEEST